MELWRRSGCEWKAEMTMAWKIDDRRMAPKYEYQQDVALDESGLALFCCSKFRVRVTSGSVR